MGRAHSAIVFIAIFLSGQSAVQAASLSVCPKGCDFALPSQAIQSAIAGDEITVRQGDYSEAGEIILDKKLVLRGEPEAIIRGSGRGNIILIKADNVTVENLDIRNSGFSYTKELAGIRVDSAKNCHIVGNSLRNNAYGVYLAESENCQVERNFIQGSGRSEVEAGNGIHSWNGRRHHFEGNIVSNHRDGMYLEFTNDSIIQNNVVTGNERYGLHFMTSHRNRYFCNRFEENGAGVAVMYSREVSMISNTFANNRGVAAYGLLLKDISKSEIKENAFSDNTIGIFMEDTNRSVFSDNIFSDNGFGLRILGNCDDNTFTKNNFRGNTFNVTTNSSRNPNTFEENYWSQYGGFDLDRNGIGDVTYRPVSLSSVVIESLDSSYLLIKSPLFLILDELEQVFPMLIPESLKDDSPLMKPSNITENTCRS